jgi:hypothetical protein
LSEAQATTLQLIAYQVAAAAACDGLTLDAAKFEKTFAELTPVDADKMTDAQKAYFDQHLLVVYGVLIGGELAALSQDLGNNCETARAAKTDPAMADVLVWQ